MLTPQQTWSSIFAHTRALPAVSRPLADALGYVLARPVVADRDLPPADRSAMDGYAVRATDVAHVPAVLRIVGEVAAGSAAAPTIVAGTCSRIFTGANVPPGADSVVRIEDTAAAGVEAVSIEVAVAHGANVLVRGENAHREDVLVPAGTRLGPGQLAVCASVGYSQVDVIGKPRVAVITTGRELLDVESPAERYQERDSNQVLLTSSLLAAGFPLATATRAPDDRRAVVETLTAALASADAVVLSGGVSVGAYDFVPTAIQDVGARTLVHGVAMKPGKPFLFALSERKQPIFGLPGNPLSAATGLHEFVLPALRRMSAWSEAACRPIVRARLRETLRGSPGRQRYVLASLDLASDGVVVTPIVSHSAADVPAGAQADGAIVMPSDGRTLDAGSFVDVRPWRALP